MKRIVLSILTILFITASVQAQKSFEGSISFAVKVMGEGSDQFAAFMPDENLFMVKGEDMRMEIKGGMTAAMLGPIIIKGKEGKAYMIKNDTKIVYTMDKDDAETKGSEVKPKVTKEEETIKILGYKCQKYKVVVESSKGSMSSNVWATEELKVKQHKDHSGNVSGASLSIDGVPGVILKTMASQSMMGMDLTFITTAKNIETKKLSPDLFNIPSDYERKNISELANGMMGN